MLTNKSSLLVLALLFPFSLMAKNLKLHPGYYLNQQGDTVKCDIELADWNRNPSAVHAVGSNGALDLSPEETKGFGVYGYVDYISAKVTYHSATVTGTDFPEKFSDSLATNRCFLKLLTKGNVDLYELKTSERTVFFIRDHGSDPFELLYRVARKENQLVEDKHYQQTLRAMFNNEGMGTKYDAQIERAAYKESDLLPIVKILNGSSNNYFSKQSQTLEPILFAGGLSYMFPSPFTGLYATNNHFSSAMSPLVGIGLLYNMSPYSGKSKVGLSLAYSGYTLDKTTSGVIGHYYSQNYWDTTSYKEHFHGSNAFVTLNFFLMYVLNPDAKVKYFLKAGTWYSFSIKKDANVYSDYTTTTTGIANGLPPTTTEDAGEKSILNVSKSFGSILVGAGLSFGRSQVGLDYALPSYTGRFNGSGEKFKIGTISLAYGYSFGRKHG